MMRNVSRTGVLVLVVLMGACSRRQAPEPPQPQAPPAQQPQRPSTPPATNNGAADRDAEARRLAAILEQIVYFDYDASTIRSDAQEQLAAKVPVLRSNPNIRIRIEGHADERGSVEYNLALGMRRASAVRDYLAGFGIDPSRMEVQSYGEDRPASRGENESAWSRNRRAEFRVTTGLTFDR